MIITLEHDGQPCLDSNSEKSVPLGIVLPQLSYYPERSFHPVFRHIDIGYAASIPDDARSEVTIDPHPTATSRKKRWQLFNSSLLFKKRPPDEPLLSRTTMDEKPRRARKHRPLPVSWAESSRKWFVGWILLSLLLCFVVAFGVWIAARRVYQGALFHPMNSEWSPKDSSIYTIPPECFGCPSNSVGNVSHFLIPVPPGLAGQHNFAIRGGASGQLTLASSPDHNAPTITYDILIQSNPPFPNKVSFNQPPPGPVAFPSTDFLIDTPTTMAEPRLTDPPECMRFEITMYIPRTLRQLTVNISTPVQITFSPQAHIELDNLTIFIANPHPKSRIDSSESVQAKSIFVEMDTGLIRGFLSLGESSKITNWHGQIQLNTIPSAPMDFSRPSTALLETTSYGNVEIRYLKNRAYRTRPIESWHTMGAHDKSVGRFDYGRSGFNGLLYSNSSKYNITNANFWKTKRGTSDDSSWPIITGNRTGEDKIYISSGSGSIVLP